MMNVSFHFVGRCFCTWLVLSLSVLAQSAADPVKERFAGTWKGQGKMTGRASQVQMKWEPVIEGRFVRLQVRTEWQTPDGKAQAFEGHAYYQKQKDGKYHATWFDAQGATLQVEGEFDGTALASLWGPQDKPKQGKSVYRLVNANEMEVIDSMQQPDGAWREFSRATFKRQ
jgi:hypothetical protein